VSLKDYLCIALVLAMLGGGIYLRHHWIAEGASQQAARDRQGAQEAADHYAALQAKAEDAAAATVHAGALTVVQTTAATQTAVRTITRIVHESPAAPVCLLPAASVRSLQGQVDAANAAARGVR
jgi:predicted lipid-binding transport protein (Tim44 family)